MFEKLSAITAGQKLGSDLMQGLSQSEAEKRLIRDGENALTEKKPKTPLQMFLAQLRDPMIYILLAAAAVSLFLREFSDAVVVLVVILLNAVIGVVQEGRAQQALAALKKLSSPTALVKRDGTVREIPAAQLVKGDVVVLEAGRQVPADLRLTFSSNLKIEESALTGESVPADKEAEFVANGDLPLGDRVNMAYMTTSVSYGRGEGIVAAAGMDTEIGRIARMIDSAEEEQTPLQKRLADLGKLLGILAVGLCVVLFIIALIQKRDIPEMLITAISLAVAAVPEGLPAVVTIVLALGVQRLVKVNTIVRRLPSVETLGSVSVVCSDKTGTLTQNRMTVLRCYADGVSFDAASLDPERHGTLLKGFMLCNDASAEGDQAVGDPTEIALIEMGLSVGISHSRLKADYPRVDELPFDSDRKMMTTRHLVENRRLAFTKGAVDQIIRRCTNIVVAGDIRPITTEHTGAILEAASGMSRDALRVLALALHEGDGVLEEEDLTFVGLVGMIDPPRPEAKEAVRIFKEASVRTVMITGDHRDTAFAIARELGIAEDINQCVTGEDLDKMTPEELADRVDRLCIYARVSPEHKVMIVNALRSKGYIVSMTGDGVNDAPSLKAADIGVAMGITGTDVAKGAADMVLTDDNFATIEKAIEEGRGIYANIKKSVFFLLSSNFGEIIAMFTSILVGLAAPLKAIQILWVNLITDSLPGLALGVDRNDTRDIMKRPPRDPRESLFAGGGTVFTLLFGFSIAFVTLGAFLFVPWAALHGDGTEITLQRLIDALRDEALLGRARTFAFTVLGVSQLFHAVGMRNIDKSVFRINHLSNRMMIVAFFLGFALQVAVTEVPFLLRTFDTVQLSLGEWAALTAVSCFPLVVHEIVVLFRRDSKQV